MKTEHPTSNIQPPTSNGGTGNRRTLNGGFRKAAAEPQTGGDAVVETPMTAPAPKRGDKLTRGGTSSGRPGQIVTAANRWRENYNPLRGLVIRRVVELLELAQRGDTAYLQWTFRNSERRYPTLSALISRCEGPMLNFDWTIKIKADLPKPEGNGTEGTKGTNGADKPKVNPFEEMAKRQQATLRSAYERIDNLKAAIQHLHLAEFRGYAHLQKWRDEAGEVYHLEPLNQWCVCRDGLEGNWFWNPDSRSTSAPLQFLGKEFCIGGERLPGEDFIIRECPRPIDEIALVNFVRSNLCEKDWDGFIEVYGLPGGVVTMPPNVPQGKESEYETAAKNVAEGGSGAIPFGADYKANDGPRGVDPFTPRIKHLDEQLVLAGTGGKLTMLAESGSGTLAGGAHEDTFNEIADGRAQKISERFQRDFDLEVLERKHPGEPVLVYFKFGTPDADSADTTKFKQAVITALAGHELLSRVIANQTDLKELVAGSGMPVNEEYTDPYVPVAESSGAMVTGEVVKDSEGDIVGGKTQAPEGKEPLSLEPGTLNPETGKTETEEGTSNNQQPTSDIQRGKGKREEGTPNNQQPTSNIQRGQPGTGAIRNRQTSDGTSLESNGKDMVVEALRCEFSALNERLAAIADIEDPEVQKAKLAAVLADLDKFESDLAKDPAVASAIYKILAAGLANGMAAGEPVTSDQ